MAGHSHNEADARHRRALQVFYPKKGVGPGCNSPLKFEAALVTGLKTLSGGFEMLWQLANFDFAKFLDGCVSKDFGNHKDKRWWRFVRDERVEGHGEVQVLYKEKLTDTATNTHEEWRPFDLVPRSEAQPKYATRPNGLRFMDRWPDTADDPGVEAFTTPAGGDNAEGGWRRQRVEKDVMDTGRKLGFTAKQESEWRALFSFHEEHQTADSVPKTPAMLTIDDGRAHTLRGAPMRWRSEVWSTLHRHAVACGRRTDDGGVAAHESSSMGASARDNAVRTAGRMPPPPLAVINGVTGIDAPRRDRSAAQKTYSQQQDFQNLPQ
jgi:hypothetical protein